MFLRAGYHFGSTTSWEAIERLEPGTCITVGPEGFSQHRYWQPAIDEDIRRLGFRESRRALPRGRCDDLPGVPRGSSGALGRPDRGYDTRLLALQLAASGVPFTANTRGDPEGGDREIAHELAGAAGWETVDLTTRPSWDRAASGHAARRSGLGRRKPRGARALLGALGARAARPPRSLAAHRRRRRALPWVRLAAGISGGRQVQPSEDGQLARHAAAPSDEHGALCRRSHERGPQRFRGAHGRLGRALRRRAQHDAARRHVRVQDDGPFRGLSLGGRGLPRLGASLLFQADLRCSLLVETRASRQPQADATHDVAPRPEARIDLDDDRWTCRSLATGQCPSFRAVLLADRREGGEQDQPARAGATALARQC